MKGMWGGSMYAILEGQCSVHTNSIGGVQDRIEFAGLTQGDIFIEMAVLTEESRKASVLAKGHVMV